LLEGAEETVYFFVPVCLAKSIPAQQIPMLADNVTHVAQEVRLGTAADVGVRVQH
jgi:hypothetical protein